MRYSLQLTILSSLCILSYTRLFKPCELGLILLKQHIEFSKLNQWVCVMHTISRYNSSLVSGHFNNPWSNYQYGIFQVSNLYYCYDEFRQKNNDCNLNCTELIDDELTNDIRCAKLIYQRGEFTFRHWGAAVNAACTKTDSPNLLENCDLLKGQPPKIITTETNLTMTLLNYSRGSLPCKVNGTLPVKIDWGKNYKKIDPDDPHFVFESEVDPENLTMSTLRIASNISQESVDTYYCEVSNLYGRDRKEYLLRITDPKIVVQEGNEVKITVAIAVAAVLIIVTVCVMAYRIWFWNYDGLSRNEITEFENGTTQTETSEYINGELIREPYRKKEFEILKSEFQIDKSIVLGSGEHGIVYKGTYKDNPVAIKTNKSGAGRTYLSALLVELKVMIFIRGHENIVGLIGANTADLRKGNSIAHFRFPWVNRNFCFLEFQLSNAVSGSVYIIVEFCPLGSLLDLLKKHRPKQHYVQMDIAKEMCIPHTSLETGNIKITESLMISWSSQLASVMEYLASKKVIHGDIACRNILMLNPETIKLTDFGLSRKLYDYTSFIKTDEEPLPWRWLAIETLLDNKFSTQSDVWSFGVTLWEIFSFGQVPYPGQTWSLEFIQRVQAGLRMTKPATAPESIYEIMKDCWLEIPEERPSFTQIRERISPRHEPNRTTSQVRYVQMEFLRSNSVE